MKKIIKEKRQLKPCPICGSEVTIFDFTENSYGFDDYRIECGCGLLYRSKSTSVYGDSGIAIGKTDDSKAQAYEDMIKSWNSQK